MIPTTAGVATPLSATANRGRRVDAVRNYDALLAAGRAVFERSGADAPFDDVAREAGVGRATLYRHFPTREHLLVALLQDRVDLLTERAEAALTATDPAAEFIRWLGLYDAIGGLYRGVSASLVRGLQAQGSPVATACGPMKQAFADLLELVQKSGVIRSDVNAEHVLTLVGALPRSTSRRSGRTRGASYLTVVIDGLRRPT